MRLALPVQRAVATIVFVLYAACAVFGGAIVRCYEADGSVSIEWRGAACCVPQSAPDAPAAPAAGAPGVNATDDCAGCEDETLAKGLASVAVRKSAASEVETRKAPLHAATFVAPERAAFVVPSVSWTHRQRAPMPPPPLTALRSVVLRC